MRNAFSSNWDANALVRDIAAGLLEESIDDAKVQ
jgi:hypothetical protein